MKTMILAAAAILSLGGAAYAGEGGPVANTLFSEIPGVVADTPAQSPAAVAMTQSGQASHTFATSSNHGTWLFSPNEYSNG